jgi:uncharacterized ferritin-like protein (DUF455 family)
MHYHKWAQSLLFGPNLEDKLLEAKDLIYDDTFFAFEMPKDPGRLKKIEFSDVVIKFPKRTSFHLDEKKGVAMHFFANHELLAIEMMAMALLRYPVINNDDLLFKKGLVKTIQDEQKHFKMYINRIKEFGIEFGDYPLNDFFWRRAHDLHTPSHFYSLMALTFESANLDFARYYGECFAEVEDKQSESIMNIVFEDEISHVALGAKWLNCWRGDKRLWEYYENHLPKLLTPARAKGIHFNKEARYRAGLDESFVNLLENYRDDFGITNRKNW